MALRVGKWAGLILFSASVSVNLYFGAVLWMQHHDYKEVMASCELAPIPEVKMELETGYPVTRITLQSNAPIFHASTCNLLTLTDAQKDSVPYSLSSNSGNYRVQMSVVMDTPRDLTLTFPRKAAMTVLAQLPDSDWTFAIRPLPRPTAGRAVIPATNAPLALSSVNSYRNWYPDENDSPLYLLLDFNKAVNLDSLRRMLSIEPAVDFRIGGVSSTSTVRVEGAFRPEEFYTIKVKPGALGSRGEMLDSEMVRYVVTSTTTSSLNFSTQNQFVLPADREQVLPVSLLNVYMARVELLRILPENRFADLMNADCDETSEKLVDTKFKVAFNSDFFEKGTLSLSELYGKSLPVGTYVLRISTSRKENNDHSYYDNYESIRFFVTDIGFHAVETNTELSCMARSLKDGKTLPNVKFAVYDKACRLLHSARADSLGLAQLPICPTGKYLMASSGEDYVTLNYYSTESQSVPYYANLTPERYNVRPGEKFTVFATLRDAQKLNAAGNVPAEFEFREPDDNTLSVQSVVTDTYGFARATFTLAPNAPSGVYTVRMRLPKTENSRWGSTSLYVSHYVPDRVKLQMTSVPSADSFNTAGTLTASAMYYFGLPVANFAYTYTARETYTRFTHPDFKKYTFGTLPGNTSAVNGNTDAAQARIQPKSTTRSGNADAQGLIWVDLPPFDFPDTIACAVDVLYSLTGSDASGRSVSVDTTLCIAPAKAYIGTHVSLEKTPSVDWVRISPKGQKIPLSDSVYAQLYRYTWNYNYTYSRSYGYSRDWYRTTEKSGDAWTFATSGNAEGTMSFSLPMAGSYLLEIFDSAGNLLAENEFDYDIGMRPERSSDPRTLVFTTDRERYLPGDVAVVSFDAPRAGELTLRFPDPNAYPQIIPVKTGRNAVKVKIPADYRFGTYTLHAVFLSNIGTQVFEPTCVINICKLSVNQAHQKLNITLDAPETTRSSSEITVHATMSDAQNKPCAGLLQVWAVDEGVLAFANTKDYIRPFKAVYEDFHPFGWTLFENYNKLATVVPSKRSIIGGGYGGYGMSACFGCSAPSSARSARKLSMELLRQTAVVVSAPVHVPASGKATISMPIPKFSGALRLIAIAFDEERIGSAEHTLRVRDPLTIQASAPLAVTVGDTFDLTVNAFAFESKDTSLSMQIKLPEGLRFSEGSQLQNFTPTLQGSSATVVSALTADRFGQFDIAISGTLDGVTWSDSLPVTVRPLVPPVSREKIVTVAPGETLKLAAPKNFEDLQNVTQFSYDVSTLPNREIIGAMQWLNAYPYGCLEQTVSAAFPLLSTPQYVKMGILPASVADGVSARLRTAYEHLLARRISYSGFSEWARGEYRWEEASFFATHFILEAEKSETPPPSELGAEARRFLSGRKATPYIYYLHALANNRHMIPYLQKTMTESMSSMDRLFGGVALIKFGYAKTGSEAVNAALKDAPWRATNWGVWTSPARQLGLALWMLMDVMPQSPYADKMALELRGMIRKDGWWGNTQNNAWAVLGLSRWLSARNFTEGSSCSLSDNAPMKGTLDDGKTVSVTNTGKSPVFITLKALGTPEKIESESRGIVVERRYLDLHENVVNTFKQGDFLQVELTLKTDKDISNFVLCDLLPGCFEIEDENLLTRSRVMFTSKDTFASNLSITCAENADERFLLFGGIQANKNARYVYRVRVVSKGTFNAPPVSVEDMYDADVRAVYAPQTQLIVR